MLKCWLTFRPSTLLQQVSDNVLIAMGALPPACGDLFSRPEISGAHHISELLGAILLFLGCLRATTPKQPSERS